MLFRFRFCAMLILASFIAGGCAESNPATPTTEPTPLVGRASSTPSPAVQPSTPPTTTPMEVGSDTASLLGYAPLYTQTECMFHVPSGYTIECGTLNVPEDRNQPQGAMIDLPVAIFKSTSENPAPDPVVHLVGGPGGSLLPAAGFYLERGGDDILKQRDYVLFNQRGTQYAEPFLACPGQSEMQWELAKRKVPLEERYQQEAAFFLACQEDLIAQGVNLSAYNSAENAADVRDLRIALGYEQINLYGISYGSRLALTVLRDHPQGVRSAILDGVLPPQANLNEDIALNVARSLDAVFADCAADELCAERYPDLETRFYQLVDDLNADQVSLRLGEGTVFIDGYDFIEAIFRHLYSIEAIPWIPMLVDEASKGDWVDDSIFAIPDRSSRGAGMFYSIWCREEMAFESREKAFALAADLPAALRDFFAGAYEWEVCSAWKAGVADPVENQAVISEVPALLFSGRYDPVLPPAYGDAAAETLANSFAYTFPTLAHGAMRSNSCALSIGLQFLDDPNREPDAGCMEKLQPVSFR